MKVGSIYIIRNKINSKVYIGQTTMTVHDRFMAHMKPSTSKAKGNYKLYNAIKKYGSNNFYVETLESDIPLNDLDDKEIEYIYKFDSFKNGYNSTPGGDGRVLNKINNEEELVMLAKKGMNPDELATLFNVNKATIFRTLHKLGFYFRPDQHKIIVLARNGLKNKDIAKIIGCDENTVCRALNRAGERKHRVPVKNRTDIDVDIIRSDYEAQMPIKKICEKHNISNSVFFRIKKTYNFKTRPQIYKHKIRYKD